MKFQGALIKEQGQTFAIVIVKPNVLQNSFDANNARNSFSPVFPGVPIVLMAQNTRGIPTYQGRTDIVNFLARVPMASIPWREYSIS